MRREAKMATLSEKKLRTIDFALDRFFTPKAWVAPRSIDDFKVPDILARELRLEGNRTLLMTDAGLEQLRAIVSIIDDADVFDGLASFSDVYSASQDVLEECLSRGQRPDKSAEFVDLVKTRLDPKIDTRTYAVPIFGLELVGVESLELGSMRVVPAAVSQLDAAGVKHGHSDVVRTIEATKARLWLIGSTRGTASVAEEKFRGQAQLAVGMLAIAAASMFKNGAAGFRIGIVMSPEDAYGPSSWLSWAERDHTLSTHAKYLSSQDFKIDADLVRQFRDSGVFFKALALLQAEARTPLEDAIARAVYWYSDAHREAVPVMKLVKYWSCVETFFSAENKDITKSVSTGLACVLVFGGYNFVPRTDYTATKTRIVKLYGLRSRALHRAAHLHVSGQDVADLSQWVAWMIINMVTFVERGYTRIEQIKEMSDKLDAQVGLTSKAP